jgi:hypothetical protein
MIVFTNPGKYPVLSGVATLGAGIGGSSIYGLVLYDLNLLVGLIGASLGIAMMLGANFAAERHESDGRDAEPEKSAGSQ